MSNIIFMGTPEFAVPALQALHAEFGVSTVVTIPDKARGRGLTVSPSAVKQAALDLGITDILQPEKLRDPAFAEEIAARRPDVICVIAFKILPRSVFSLSSKGTFNVHASLLPRFRGAAPINHAIMEGDTESGVTSFLLDDIVDTGTILLQQHCHIPDGTTAGELYAMLMPMAADCACATTRGLLNGTLQPQPQDDSQATPAPKVFRESACIDWSAPRMRVRNFIHAHSPSPCAWTIWNGDVLKIFRASITDEQLPIGTWKITETTLLIGCADGALSIDELQLPGKRRMAASEMIPGYRGPREGALLVSGTDTP
jgi:methionyl-tRNA formyltransferase